MWGYELTLMLLPEQLAENANNKHSSKRRTECSTNEDAVNLTAKSHYEAKMKMVVAVVMFGGGGWEVVDEGDVSGVVREVMVMTSAAGGDEGEVAFRVAVGS
ncbi:hypothetical protein Tco_0514957 [Tanacetum coccineum]